MIRVNLLPGGKKGPRGPRLSLSMPSIGGISSDTWVLSAVAITLVALLGMGFLFVTTSSRRDETSLAVEEAVRDSIRFADLIAQTEALQARRDSIAEKVSIIQEIDADRYIWAHIMDEVARALPEFTWLTGIVQVAQAQQLDFQIRGRAGNNFVLTRFMENLEASPFIRNVQLISTVQVVAREGGMEGVQRLVHEFQLQAVYDQPPVESLETVPLFDTNVGGAGQTSGVSPASSGPSGDR